MSNARHASGDAPEAARTNEGEVRRELEIDPSEELVHVMGELNLRRDKSHHGRLRAFARVATSLIAAISNDDRSALQQITSELNSGTISYSGSYKDGYAPESLIGG